MLVWLENWLQGIIAVILLAVIVELLLPNSKLIRYTRLVVGLILLLTILSPIMKLFEKDFISSLDASYTLWDEKMSNSSLQTPTLEQIQNKAVQLQKNREQQAARLTAATIEKSIYQDLISNGQSNVKEVQVHLAYDEKDKEHAYPFIQKATIYVQEQASSISNSERSVAIPNVEVSEVEEVAAIDINVVEAVEHNDLSEAIEAVAIDEESLPSNYGPIMKVLMENWGLAQNQINIALIN